MSRVGQKPITIPPGVDVKLNGVVVSVTGPKGMLTLKVSDGFQVQQEKGVLTLVQSRPEQDLSSRHGLYRSLIANMVQGVTKDYVKMLEIQGVGFKAAVQGKKVMFSLGYSSPVILDIPAGVDIKVNENVNVVVSGPDKQLVGNLAASIKALYPAEPYKGKGIRFKGEHVRRKVGKTVA